MVNGDLWMALAQAAKHEFHHVTLPVMGRWRVREDEQIHGCKRFRLKRFSGSRRWSWPSVAVESEMRWGGEEGMEEVVGTC